MADTSPVSALLDTFAPVLLSFEPSLRRLPRKRERPTNTAIPGLLFGAKTQKELLFAGKTNPAESLRIGARVLFADPSKHQHQKPSNQFLRHNPALSGISKRRTIAETGISRGV